MTGRCADRPGQDKVVALPGYGAERLLASVLAKRDDWDPEHERIGPWLADVARALGLDAIAAASPDRRDQGRFPTSTRPPACTPSPWST